MNALRQYITPSTDILEMKVKLPNDLQAKRLEVIIMVADDELVPKSKGILAKQRGKFKHFSDDEKAKMLKNLDEIHNE
jgi:hypothetical protein